MPSSPSSSNFDVRCQYLLSLNIVPSSNMLVNLLSSNFFYLLLTNPHDSNYGFEDA